MQDDFRELTDEQIDEIINWFNTVKDIHNFEYINSNLLKNILIKNVTIDKNGEYKYNHLSEELTESDSEEEKLVNTVLKNWKESNTRISEYAKLSTLERVKYLRQHLNIPENYNAKNKSKPTKSQVDDFKIKLQQEYDRRQLIKDTLSEKESQLKEIEEEKDKINENIKDRKSIIDEKRNQLNYIRKENESLRNRINEIKEIKTPIQHDKEEAITRLPKTNDYKIRENILNNRNSSERNIKRRDIDQKRDKLRENEDDIILEELEEKIRKIEQLRLENQYLDDLNKEIDKMDKKYSPGSSYRKKSPIYGRQYQTYMNSPASINLEARPPTPTPMIYKFNPPISPSPMSFYPPYPRNINNNNDNTIRYSKFPINQQYPEYQVPVVQPEYEYYNSNPSLNYKSFYETPRPTYQRPIYERPIYDKPKPFSDSLYNTESSFKTEERFKNINNIINKYEKYDMRELNKNSRESENNMKNEQKVDNKIKMELLDEDKQTILKNINSQNKDELCYVESDVSKKIEDDYSSEDYSYFVKLDKEEQEYYMYIENAIKIHNKTDIPLRFKILNKDINIDNKSIIIKKIDDNNKNKFSLGSENNKFNNWLTGLLKIPFGEYKKLPITVDNTKEEICDYLNKSKNILDKAVYGHSTTKNQIIQLLTQWITNPSSGGNVIGIQGPMGNGKTTLVKDGISKAVDRPFAFITLGGCSDSSFLEGHNYTYEGSMWGKIVDVLIQTKCMNPIIYFDELDKVSQTKRGEEIINMLIHLTDSSQNKHFQDKYFTGIDIDISKCIFIFSYNDIEKISPILLDRLLTIKTEGFSKEDKIKIANEYLINEIIERLGMDKEKLSFENEVIGHLIETYTDEKGVRSLKKSLEIILSKLNVLIITEGKDILTYDIEIDYSGKIEITKDIADTLIKEFHKDIEKDKEMEFAMYC